MDISRLPQPGADFSMSDPHHGFRKRFSEITLHSEYHNIREAADLIVGEIEKHKDIIEKSGLPFNLRHKIWLNIREGDKNLTHQDMDQIKEMLEYLGQ